MKEKLIVVLLIVISFSLLENKSKIIEKELKLLDKHFKIIKLYNKKYKYCGNSYSLFLGLKKIA